MATAPDVTVIIPAFNSARTITDQLVALASQESSRTWELLVVDNNSTDETAAIVERHRDQIGTLRVVGAESGQSAAFARNAGVRAARSARLLFCDADDVISHGWIDALADALDHHDAVGGPIDDELLNEGVSLDIRRPLVGDHLPEVMGWKRAGSGNLGVRADVFAQIGGFDERIEISEDTDFCIRLQIAGFTLGFAPEAVVHCRHQTGLWTNLRQVYRWNRTRPAMFARFERHGAIRTPKARSIAFLFRLALRLPTVFLGSRRRNAWLGSVARASGRVVGSVRARRWYI